VYVNLITIGDPLTHDFTVSFGLLLPTIALGKAQRTDWGDEYRRVGVELNTKWIFDIMPTWKVFEFSVLGFGISMSLQEGY
jgi:hypothetical protein